MARRKDYRESNSKFIVKKKGDYPTRYKSASPDLDMKKQQSKAYKSRYSSSLSPDNEIVMTEKSSYRSRY